MERAFRELWHLHDFRHFQQFDHAFRNAQSNIADLTGKDHQERHNECAGEQ